MYIKITNGQPKTTSIGQFRRDNPNISFPKNITEETLNAYDTYSYTIDEQPLYNKRDQKVSKNFYEDSNGLWKQGWVVTDKTAEEISQYDAQMTANVKAEAQRRITAIMPEWKQRNLTARAAELAIKGSANWTAEEQAEYSAGQAVWDQIKAIRIASNTLEAMSPIPENYTDEYYWS